MSTQLTIVVSVPPKCLSPNAGFSRNYFAKSKAKGAVKYEMLLRLREAIPEGQHWPYCRMDVEWIGAHHNVLRMDSDNVTANLKWNRDALEAHGLVVNDNTVRMGSIKMGVDKANPRVVLTLTRMEAP